MQGWQIDQFGEPETMRWAEWTLPVPADGEVVVDVEAAGVNFFDLLQLRGQYQDRAALPFTPGAEVAGTVAGTGERVIAFCAAGGGYAEQVLVPRRFVFALPGCWSFSQGASFLVVYHTAWFALSTRARVAPGEWLLVHAGASGTGMAAIQAGRSLGARVMATAGSPEKLDFCRRMGAEEVILYSHPGWVDQVKALTGGRGVDVAFDPVGGDIFDQTLRCMAMEGRLVIIGFASGRIPQIAANRLLLRNITAVGAIWGSYMQAHPEYLAHTQTLLSRLAGDGVLLPAIGAEYALRDAPRALRDLEQRRIIGKAVLVR